MLKKAGLSLSVLAADRQGLYRGKPVQDLPNLSAVEKQVIARRLAEQLPRAASSAHEGALLASADTGERHWVDDQIAEDPGSQRLRQQEQENEVLEQEILGLIAEQRASRRVNRAILFGALVGLLLVHACGFLLGVVILLLML